MFKFNNQIISPHDIEAKKMINQLGGYFETKYNILKDNFPEAKVIAEIGVRAGYSAWSFLQACPMSEFHGFDMDSVRYGKLSNGKKYTDWAKFILGNYNFKLHTLNTQDIDKFPVNKKFDFIHIDGDHTKEGVKHDLDLCFNSLSKNEKSFMLIDDYTHPQLKGVKAGVDEWINENRQNVINKFIPSFRGEMLIWRKK